VDALKVEPRAEFQATRIACRQNLTEEWSEVGIRTRDAIVRVVKKIEALGTKSEGDAFANHEAAIKCDIDDLVSRTRNDISASITEGVRGRVAKGSSIEPAIDGSLAGGKADTLAGHDVRPIGSSRIGKICREIERIYRRAILQRDQPAKLPVTQGFRQVIHESGAEAARDISKGEASFQTQITFILCAGAIELTDVNAVGIVDRFRPYVTGEKGERGFEMLLSF